MDAMIEQPLFELLTVDGHVYKLYENGVAVGFPHMTLVVNRARGELNSLRARIEQIPAPSVTNEQR